MSGAPADVVIVGGGVAAVESLIALRDLAGERVRIKLVAPAPDFVYRPMLVGEPFGGGEARHHALREIAADFDAVVVQAAVVAVDARGRRVICRSGATIGYDSLVLAPGARILEAFEDAIAFGRTGAGAAMGELVERLKARDARRVAFIVPTRVGWSLPLYELALMTAAAVRAHGVAGREAVSDHAGGAAARRVRRAAERAGRRAACRSRHRVRRGHVRRRRSRESFASAHMARPCPWTRSSRYRWCAGPS